MGKKEYGGWSPLLSLVKNKKQEEIREKEKEEGKKEKQRKAQEQRKRKKETWEGDREALYIWW